MNKTLISVLFSLFVTNSVFSQNTWQSQSSPVNTDLISICFTDTLNGWIASEDGEIIHTTDGGNNWQILKQFVNFKPSGIVFINNNLGWIAGKMSNITDTACIMHTTNGGNNWGVIYKNAACHLNDLFFINDTLGWAAGWELIGSDMVSLILYTVDGGDTWTMSKGIRIQDELFGIHFRDTESGAACGKDGIFFTTDNGGRGSVFGWAAEISIPSYGKDLYDIYNAGTMNGCAVGEGGFILFTKDGWANHYDYESASQDTLMGVTGTADGIRFWAAGRNGSIVKMVFGLIPSIVEEDPVTSHDLNDIFAVSSNCIWAVGEEGTILFYGASLNSNNDIRFMNRFLIYPNPATDKVCIKSHEYLIRFVQLLTIDGKQLLNIAEPVPLSSIELDISDIARGIYFLKINNQIARIIIK